MILSHGGDQYCHLDTLNIKICPLFQIILTEKDLARSFVPILATREAVAPLLYDPMMLATLILLFRQIEHQNLSIISDFLEREQGWCFN